MANPPTIKEIAEKLHLAKSTVSRALHDHPSIGLRTRMKVQELARALNYEPNQTAIHFQQKKTFTIGIVLPELSEAFFSAAISGIEDAANQHNYMVLLGQSHDDAAREKKIVEIMKNHRVDGLIVSLAKNTGDYAHFEALEKFNIPVVFFDRIPDKKDIHYVACNMESGTLQAVSLLLEKGHRVIGMINGPEQLVATPQREAGFKQALQKKRLKFDASLTVHSDLTKEGTRAAMQQLLSNKRKVTAIVTFNDYVAQDAVQYALEQGIKVNKDLTFVSYANLPLSSYMAFPPIASVEQYPYEQGFKATEILLSLLNNKEQQQYHHIVIDSRLIVR
ncbi:LacI family DNA-binding transcriptional regulator [Chitinophaga sp. LS1]|uniref:LacI family DNA-binding transcriptional regulator n=1 Tax=Chitinophaga sp. LS1 TaxID=3051176 RepID=UPI002AAA70B9|nr:LacI family DNA-binding transcriptional regulator [Chitinophaga sp. LS1]WPV67423.1 LacI family DNA-binding transcriptional regulator [Chitinophaga sp. LS1]